MQLHKGLNSQIMLKVSVKPSCHWALLKSVSREKISSRGPDSDNIQYWDNCYLHKCTLGTREAICGDVPQRAKEYHDLASVTSQNVSKQRHLSGLIVSCNVNDYCREEIKSQSLNCLTCACKAYELREMLLCHSSMICQPIFCTSSRLSPCTAETYLGTDVCSAYYSLVLRSTLRSWAARSLKVSRSVFQFLENLTYT